MKNMKFGISIALVTSVISAILFGLIAKRIGESKTLNFDVTIISYIRGMESPLLTKLMTFFTEIGNGLSIVVITIIVMIVLYKFLDHRRELLFLAGVIMGSSLLNVLLKLLFQRERPTIDRLVEAIGYSFPSGHSMAAFSLYGALAFLIWKHLNTVLGRVMVLIVSSLFIVTIGISRIYLGVHYPSDIIGGYLMSACWLTSSIWFYQSYSERLERAKFKKYAKE
jgi:undecaprenyl-diphosphatase